MMNDNITRSQHHAIDEEFATGIDYIYRENKRQGLNNNIEAGRLSVTSDCGNRASDDSNGRTASSQNQETSLSTSGEVSRGYSALNISGWPAAPQKLTGFSIPLFIGDIILTMFPVAFLALGIFAWRLDGQELSRTGVRVERAMSVGPTIYPLVFAAIGGRCLRNIAIRFAERGTTISTLEKLLGSQSLVSALGTAFTLRSINVLSIALLVLWFLSPLGGQSSLRLLLEVNSTIWETSTVHYSDPAASLDLVEAGYWFAVIPTILGASIAMSADVKRRPVDLWNHPKVPRIDSVEQQALNDPDVEGEWITVNQTYDVYASCIGVVVRGLPPDRRAVFQVRSLYMYVDCVPRYSGDDAGAIAYLRSPDIVTYPKTLNETSANQTSSETVQEVLYNKEVYGFGPKESMIQSSSFFVRAAWNSSGSAKNIDSIREPSLPDKQQPIEYLYGSLFNSRKTFEIQACKPNIVTVDAEVTCEAENCKVTKLRKAPNFQEGNCIMYYERNIGCLKKGNQAVSGLIKYLPTVTTQAFAAAVVNPYDEFIAGNDVPYRTLPQEYSRNRSEVTDKTISERLTVLLNSYWYAGTWGSQITTGNLSSKPEAPREKDSIDPRRWVNTTEAVISHEIILYSAIVGWIVTLLLISAVLLFLSIANVIFSFLTIAPDLFYYASSLARENPYTDTPDGGTALDGGERSRLLKAMKVQIADVSPENQIGYVVLKSLGSDDDFKTGRLKRDRLYW